MFRENVKNSIVDPRDGLEAEHESLSGLKYRITVERVGNSVQTKFYKLQEGKRTMSLIDEFNAATQSLDRILEKMDEADPADKERLEAYVKSMQVKVQQILKAILRVH
jgi:hypothetical protein